MNFKKILGLFAVAGLLAFAVPTSQASAAPLATPGIASAVQAGLSESMTTEVQYRRDHRGYRPHRGYRRPAFVRRPPPHRHYRGHHGHRHRGYR